MSLLEPLGKQEKTSIWVYSWVEGKHHIASQSINSTVTFTTKNVSVFIKFQVFTIKYARGSGQVWVTW